MITSKANPRIKEIRILKDPKFIKKSDSFYMEGLRIIGEALQKNSEIETIISCPEILKNGFGSQLVNLAKDKGIEILEVSKAVFESFSHKENPQGLAAIGKQHFSQLEELEISHGLIIALNEVADPGNLGTIIRTADAVSCEGILLLGDTTNPYELNAIRGSMGAIFSQKIVKTDPIILLMGSERQGLNNDEMKACDLIVRIPMMQSSDSLNLAVATGVMLYEIFNNHRKNISRNNL